MYSKKRYFAIDTKVTENTNFKMMEGISEPSGMDIKKENDDESLNIIKDVINSEVSLVLHF